VSREIHIEGRRIGPGHPVYVIAELSANHGQELEQALELVDAAAAAGADAVKLQTYTPETMTLDLAEPMFRIGKGTQWAGRNLFDLYREAYTPWEWYPEIARVCQSAGLALFSTPFDASAVDFLEQQRTPAYKIASFELVDLPLLERVAATGKPVILSTGMATLAEVEEAVETLRHAGASQIALLKCTSAYPAEPGEMNLRSIPDLSERFDVPVGLSDHSIGPVAPVTAVSLGASLIEKHLTLSRAAPGPDSSFSLEPDEFRAMVDAVRTTQAALGQVSYGPTERERPSLAFRRSLFVVAPVRAGERFTEHNVRSIRPGYGLHPRHLAEVLGRVAARDVAVGTPMAWELVEGGADR
jgi:N-acetylneuraminate synthase